MIPKYKAWDKVNKKMIEDVASIHFKSEMIATSNLCFYPFKDIELLQSTGLFDKNGKKVFESEIVDVRTLEGTIYLRGVVKKVKGSFYIEGLHFSKNIPLTDFYFKSYTNTLEIEILGNVYQDEHLLGKD